MEGGFIGEIMGRIRTIKPEFFLHEDLYDLEKETKLPVRLSYIGLWCQADREGRFKWSCRKLKAQILPYDDVDFSRVLDALMTRGFLRKYHDLGGVEYGVIPSFKDHQFINNKEKPSTLPDPDKCNNENSLTREPRDDDALMTRGVKERNVNKDNNPPIIPPKGGTNGNINFSIETAKAKDSAREGGRLSEAERVERMRKYFESLSPKERQSFAYTAKGRAEHPDPSKDEMRMLMVELYEEAYLNQ